MYLIHCRVFKALAIYHSIFSKNGHLSTLYAGNQTTISTLRINLLPPACTPPLTYPMEFATKMGHAHGTKGYSITMVYTATSLTQPTCKLISNLPNISIEIDSLVLILVADLPHLTQLMPSSAERVLELQDFDLKAQSLSVTCSKPSEAKIKHIPAAPSVGP